MPMLFGPILAQVVSVAVGDRTEGRYIAAPDKHFEASTGPNIGMHSAWQHLTLSLGYGAGISVAPIESTEAEQRQTTVFNSAYLGAAYSYQHTLVTVGQTVGYGTLNFATQALAGAPTLGAGAPTGGVALPTTPGGPAAAPPVPASLPIGTVVGAGGAPVDTGTPGSGQLAANQLRALNQKVHYASSTTSVGVTQILSRRVLLGGEASYLIGGAVRANERRNYPIVRGPRFAALFAYRLDPRDDLSSALAVQHSSSSGVAVAGAPAVGVSAWLGSAAEGWAHRFDLHTSSTLSAGVGVTRSPIGNGFVSYSVYPTFGAGISTSSFVERGLLTLSANTGAAPVLDPIAQRVDPRVAFGFGAAWGRDRFSTAATASGTLSVAGESSAGALKAVGASASVGYRLGAAVSTDAGLRTAYQLYQGQNVVPFTYGIFVGLSFGLGASTK